MFRRMPSSTLRRAVLGAGLVPAVLAAAAAALPAPALGEILLNEILADPARDWDLDGTVSSRDDEWVEIVNTGPEWVNLAGYRLAAGDSTARYEFSGVLGPGQVQVVFGRQSYDWEVANGFPAYGLRLSNIGGEILLLRQSGGQPARIDSYTWSDHEAEDDRASGRGPDGGPDWLLLDGYNPWSGSAVPLGSGCFPSPGTRMSCPTPVEITTWSRIKETFAR